MAFLRRHPYIKRIFRVLLEKKFEGARIGKTFQKDDVVHTYIHLPANKEVSDLEKILPNLQQELGATAVKLGKARGKVVEVLFGMRRLSEEEFSLGLLQPDSLKVIFPSAYGEHVLDFEDGASCHLLNGGVTRMGKTCFLLYVATCIFLQNKGNVSLYISSAKLKDYYPFENIPNVFMSKTIPDMKHMLQNIIREYHHRNKLLYSPKLRKATDAKSIRKLYPSFYDKFKPVFLIIDEYARFSEDKEIQDMVTEIVETAGFVNIHVIIASQRPDASTVLKSRIRANLLTRIAFTTADKKNSEIILDREGAEELGRIPGRGILLDSDSHIIQVPYLDVVECDKLLESYQKGLDDNDGQGAEGNIDIENTTEIQSMFAESTSVHCLQGEQQPGERGESSTETDVIEWDDIASGEGT